MDMLAQDVRYIARSFVRTPGFFVTTVATLALGIGAATAIFSVVNGVLLRPLPYPRSDRIVQLFQLTKAGARNSVSEPNFLDWRSETRSFSAIALSSGPNAVTVNGLSEPLRVRAAAVSRDFFTVFGMSPLVGRTFAEDEFRAGAPTSVIVSQRFWRDHLSSSPAAVGSTLKIDGDVLTMVGVMPAALDFPVGTDLWLPHEPNGQSSRTAGGWRAVARIKDGVALEQSRMDLSAVSRRLKLQYGDQTEMVGAETVALHEMVVGNVRRTLLVLLGASAFLLLIACGNVVNLLVARMSTRRGEIGLRMALGASRVRLARQLLTEAVMLSVAGALLGVVLAAMGVQVLLAMQPGSIPRAADVHVDWVVMLFALGVALVAAISLAALSAWHAMQSDIRQTLASSQRSQAGSGSSARIRRGLVVMQMALTVVLLVGASLLGRSFVRLLEIDPGFRTQHLVILDAELPFESGAATGVRRAAFYEELMARLATIPGVRRVGGASGVPLVGGGSDGRFIVMSRIDETFRMEDFAHLAKEPGRTGYANFMVVDGDYFAAMNIPVITGRGFTGSDRPDAPHVAVVSASLARTKWPNESAIGKIIQYGNMDGDRRPFTVVGVVGDVREEKLTVAPTPTFYAFQPQRTNAAQTFHIVMQTASDPVSIIAAARRTVRAMRPDIPVALRTIDTVVADSVADRRFVLVLVGVFAGVALLLATLGVYSVVSYLVTQRRQEIGVRIALGAQRGDVLALVLRQGATLGLLGIAIGGAGALALTRLLKGLVFGVSTTDPLAFGGVMALLTGVALVASWLPARRAARVDPMKVLRES